MTRAAVGKLAALLLVIASTPAGAFGQKSAAPAAPVVYSVSMPEPATHMYSVSFAFTYVPPKNGPDFVDLRFPVWSPGSYLVREFERHLQDFTATVNGLPARWAKTDKATWRVWVPKKKTSSPVSVAYRIYANDLSVRTSHLDDSHGYFNGSNLFLYADSTLASPARLVIETPKEWDIATGLNNIEGPVRNGDVNRSAFFAPDFDRLVDSPVEMGTFQRLTFDAVGKPHEIVIWGAGNYDAERLKTDFKKFVEAAAAIFGKQLPYDRYVFILQLFPGGGGGLEHLNSTVIESPPYVFQKKDSYRDFLSTAAHEYFHAWLVKRIRPVALGPFDYSRENYTSMLWLMEGGTDFYANVLLLRAALITEDEYYKEMAKTIDAIERNPGRKHQSLEESSFDAWIKFYRPSDNAVNSQVNYYTKGALVTAMLDLDIRGKTGGAKSFDDVLRFLWTTYTSKGLGVPEGAVEAAATAVAGTSMSPFFDKYVRGVEDIPYDEFLKVAGRKLVAESPKDESRVDPSTQAGWLGASVADSGGRVTVTSVLDGSPAWTAGLNTGDELLAIDGVRITAGTLGDRLADRPPGTTVACTIFRRDELRTVKVTLGTRPPDKYRIEKIDDKKPAEKPAAAG